MMDDEVALPLIRLWCEGLEDPNPVYYDDGVARESGFDGIIAPSPMIMVWSGRAEWTPWGTTPSTAEEFRAESSDFPHSVGLGSVQIHRRPLVLGERLAVHQFVNPPSEAHETERGFGQRQGRLTCLRDASGDEVASIEFEALRLGIPDADDAQEPALPPMPRFEGPPASPASAAEEGQVLPELAMPVTFKRCIKWVAASRDFFEVHHDAEYARRMGAPDMYIGIHFFHGLVGRYITDWTGPRAFLQRMDFRHWGRCFPGETALVSGRIKSLTRERGDSLADLEIAVGCERGRLYDVAATVSLRGARRKSAPT
jgi:hypothetical protein